jgi:hypothetical protein
VKARRVLGCARVFAMAGASEDVESVAVEIDEFLAIP